MKKNQNTILIILGIIVIIMVVGKFNLGNFSASGTSTVSRTLPTGYVTPGSTFSVTYNALNAPIINSTDAWAVSLHDEVSGGCLFVLNPTDKANFYSIWTSEADGLTKTYTVKAPATPGTCTFGTGDYMFNELPTGTIVNGTVTVCSPTCTRPADLCVQASTVSNGCGGYCTGSWTVTTNTPADTNCDGKVRSPELVTYSSVWTSNPTQANRNLLGAAITAWINTRLL